MTIEHMKKYLQRYDVLSKMHTEAVCAEKYNDDRAEYLLAERNLAAALLASEVAVFIAAEEAMSAKIKEALNAGKTE